MLLLEERLRLLFGVTFGSRWFLLPLGILFDGLLAGLGARVSP